jgi:UDP-glucose 4-epimerase
MKKILKKRFFITGGAGFIGSNLCEYLTAHNNFVTVYDNFSNGKDINLKNIFNTSNLNIIKADVRDTKNLQSSIQNHDYVIHLASNSDIASSISLPDIDFDNGIFLTKCVLEAMRKNNMKNIIFTSGSGVYGVVPDFPIPENFSPLIPISTYGAQKLSSENYLSAYSFMFDMNCIALRFSNVVGPNQTHGVIHDFILKLFKNNSELQILGDGHQSKPFIHILDIISAINIIINKIESSSILFDVFNVASQDSITVKEIADLICCEMGLSKVNYKYSGGTKGWKCDIPKYSLDTSKIRKLGWDNIKNSKEAALDSIKCMILEIKKGNYK